MELPDGGLTLTAIKAVSRFRAQRSRICAVLVRRTRLSNTSLRDTERLTGKVSDRRVRGIRFTQRWSRRRHMRQIADSIVVASIIDK